MDPIVSISSEQLKVAIQHDLEQFIHEATHAVNTAPGGRVIAASEGPVREAAARFRKVVYEKAIELRTQAAQAAFPPSGR